MYVLDLHHFCSLLRKHAKILRYVDSWWNQFRVRLVWWCRRMGIYVVYVRSVPNMMSCGLPMRCKLVWLELAGTVSCYIISGTSYKLGILREFILNKWITIMCFQVFWHSISTLALQFRFQNVLRW